MLPFLNRQNNNSQGYNTLLLYQFFIDEIYIKISSANKYYPDFKNWYYNNVIPSIIDGDKEFIFELRNNKLVGIAIIKHSEKKLCHLSIFEEYKNRGYGLKLFEQSFRKLETKQPYLTVSEEKYIEFKKIFNYYGFELSYTRRNTYRNNKIEYYFNAKKPNKTS